MTAYRNSSTSPIQCPVLDCHEAFDDLKHFLEHIGKDHTEQQNGSAMPATDAAEQTVLMFPFPRSKATPLASPDLELVLVPDTPPMQLSPLFSEAADTAPASDISTLANYIPSHAMDASQSPNHLNRFTSYLETNELFRLMGIHYHTHYKVLICDCGQAVLHDNCIKHISGHGIKLTQHQKTAYSNKVKDLILVASTTEVATPMPGGPPIELLTHHLDGYCCNECFYCAPTKKTIENHWYKNHKKDLRSGEDRFHRGTLQTFFTPVGQHYFEVNPSISGLPKDDMFTLYMRNEITKYPPFPTSNPTNIRDIPLLLQVTQWHDHLAAYTCDHQRRDALRLLVKLPSQHTPSGLGHLGHIVFEYLKVIRTQAYRSSQNMRKHLIECPMSVASFHLPVSVFDENLMASLSRNVNCQLWDPHGDDNTLRRYGHPLHAMAQAVLLTLKPHASGYSFPLTATTHAAAHQLLRELDNSGDDSKAISALHKLVYPILSYQDIVGEFNKWEDVLECFTAVYFLQRDGTFPDAHLTTQYFAMCKYLCRAVTLHEALAQAQEKNRPSNKYADPMIFQDM